MILRHTHADTHSGYKTDANRTLNILIHMCICIYKHTHTDYHAQINKALSLSHTYTKSSLMTLQDYRQKTQQVGPDTKYNYRSLQRLMGREIKRRWSNRNMFSKITSVNLSKLSFGVSIKPINQCSSPWLPFYACVWN